MLCSCGGETCTARNPAGPRTASHSVAMLVHFHSKRWTSTDRGANWARVKSLTPDSEFNHTYVRRPVDAHPDFSAIWADGNARGPSPSHLYVTDREGYDYLHHAEVGSSNAAFVGDEVTDRFAVLGPADEHVAKLRELADAGVDQFNLYLMNGDEEAQLAYAGAARGVGAGCGRDRRGKGNDGRDGRFGRPGRSARRRDGRARDERRRGMVPLVGDPGDGGRGLRGVGLPEPGQGRFALRVAHAAPAGLVVTVVVVPL